MLVNVGVKVLVKVLVNVHVSVLVKVAAGVLVQVDMAVCVGVIVFVKGVMFIVGYTSVFCGVGVNVGLACHGVMVGVGEAVAFIAIKTKNTIAIIFFIE